MAGTLAPEPLELLSTRNGRLAFGYPINLEVGCSVAYACGVGKATSNLHSCLRGVSKGAGIEVGLGRGPLMVRSPEEESAVVLYDERSAADQGPEGNFGTFTKLIVEEGNLAVFFRTQEPFASSFGDFLPDFPGMPETEVNYMPAMLSLDAISGMLQEQALADPNLWHPDLANLVALHLLCMLLVTRKDTFLLKVMVNGYDLVSSSRLVKLFNEGRGFIESALSNLPGLAPHLAVNGEAFLEGLLGMRAVPWPLLSGPPALVAGNGQIALNLSSASDRLLQLLQMPAVDGAAANIRAQAFERSVQDRIDSSEWRPPDALGNLVGRQLKRGGRKIGEIDAIAQRRGVTILVACKARLYTQAYDSGDFVAIRSAMLALKRDLAEWETFVADLDSMRTGDNFDLSLAGQFVAIVVSPHVMFVEPQTLQKQALPGLHAYSSAGEFARWLQSS